MRYFNVINCQSNLSFELGLLGYSWTNLLVPRFFSLEVDKCFGKSAPYKAIKQFYWWNPFDCTGTHAFPSRQIATVLIRELPTFPCEVRSEETSVLFWSGSARLLGLFASGSWVIQPSRHLINLMRPTNQRPTISFSKKFQNGKYTQIKSEHQGRIQNFSL